MPLISWLCLYFLVVEILVLALMHVVKSADFYKKLHESAELEESRDAIDKKLQKAENICRCLAMTLVTILIPVILTALIIAGIITFGQFIDDPETYESTDVAC